MTKTLREFLKQAKDILDKHPEALDAPVFAHDTSSGVIYADVSMGNIRKVEKRDLDASPFDDDDIGRVHIPIYLD